MPPKNTLGQNPPTPEEEQEHHVSELNLAYVALTRAAKNLTVISIPNPKTGQISPYIRRAGLKEGENVPKPDGVPTVDPEVKTAALDSTLVEGAWHIAQLPTTSDQSVDTVSYDRRQS